MVKEGAELKSLATAGVFALISYAFAQGPRSVPKNSNFLVAVRHTVLYGDPSMEIVGLAGSVYSARKGEWFRDLKVGQPGWEKVETALGTTAYIRSGDVSLAKGVTYSRFSRQAPPSTARMKAIVFHASVMEDRSYDVAESFAANGIPAAKFLAYAFHLGGGTGDTTSRALLLAHFGPEVSGILIDLISNGSSNERDAALVALRSMSDDLNSVKSEVVHGGITPYWTKEIRRLSFVGDRAIEAALASCLKDVDASGPAFECIESLGSHAFYNQAFDASMSSRSSPKCASAAFRILARTAKSGTEAMLRIAFQRVAKRQDVSVYDLFLKASKPVSEAYGPLLVLLLNEDSEETRSLALDELGRLGNVKFLPDVVSILADKSEDVRNRALVAVGTLKGDEYLWRMIEATESSDTYTRQAGIEAIGCLGKASNLPSLSKFCADDNKAVREVLVAALERIGGGESVKMLTLMARDPEPSVRESVRAALSRMKG